MDTFWKDISYALRMLAKKPGFTAVAVLSLTLGIGANSTIFTLVNAVFLQSVPVRQPGRVVSLFTTDVLNRGTGGFLETSVPNLQDYREKTNVFSGLSLVVSTGLNLNVSGQTVPLFAQLVNWDFFKIVGVEPMLGRGFEPEDDKAARPVVVLSNALWKRQFGGQRTILGRTLQLGPVEFTVLGVMPPEFHNIGNLGSAEVWIPQSLHDQVLIDLQKEWFNERRPAMGDAVARLKPGVSLGTAQAAVHALGLQLERQYPKDNAGRNAMLLPIDQTNVDPNQRSLFVRAGALMMVVVGLVLLIACANVANLLLARASQRQREVAIRLSLGASRGRLVRQLLTESLLLGLLAAFFGLLFAYWARPAILWLLPANGAPADLPVTVDWRVMAFTVGLALVATVLFGLVPAFAASKTDRMSVLRDRTDAPSSSGRWYGLRGALVITQVAFSLIALVGAGLFIHSLRNAQQVDPGFEVRHELLLNLNTTQVHYPQAQAEGFYRDVQQRLSSVPGVAAAAIADTFPLAGGLFRTTFPDGVDYTDPRFGKLTPVEAVQPGYFAAAGIAMLRGRDFSEHDTDRSQLVAVVNQALADRLWPEQDPLGKHLHFLGQDWNVEVIGEVRTVKFQSLGEPPQPVVYFALRQRFAPLTTLYVRAAGDPNALIPTVRSVVQSLAPAMQLQKVTTMQQAVDQNLTAAKLGADLLAAFGLIALLLAAVGTYGVMSYTVSQRTQEIGIRMALGAQPGTVLWLILANGMIMVGTGVIAGLLVASMFTRSVSSLLYGIGAFDPLAAGATSALLLLVALVACYLPARRAMRVDPVIALRYE
jgi:predicted permease